ncbi:MAG: type II 3-dehydroquinate dehydratase [Pseudomonadota bacterium]
MRILILNGPNLNLLGTRQPEVYGTTTLSEIEDMCLAKAHDLNVSIEFRQSNHEGVLVDWIQAAKGKFDAIIINAAAYTHTSVAILDALLSVEIPCMELHLSDISQREDFRKVSYIDKASFAQVMGHGPAGYPMAIETAVEHLRSARSDVPSER